MSFLRKTLLTLCWGVSIQMMMAQPVAPEKREKRPDHVNNAETPYFPAVFNQDGGSCGSASRIGYMFTYEINAFRKADARKPENIYPTHFTWLLTNSNSGKEGMARANGVPNSRIYGGTTYSKIFGNQDCSSAEFGWMQGYDQWYAAMFNRISHNSFSPYGLDTEEGRELVKNWLWNHNGDKDFGAGGICGIGVASACKQGEIADDPQGINKKAGVTGMKYVTRWGDGVDHALTIVGYDDRIVFDLDSNKVYGEKDKDECGAWIIVNSWGNGWANKGFIYCPYKYSFPVRQREGGAWKPEFYHVRKDYRPKRTLKLKMQYSRRSEIKLSVGVATRLDAREPERMVDLEHFKFAGDGRTNKKDTYGLDAPTPMLGRWADGWLHEEPMELGYDLTDLTEGMDTRSPLKYFLIVETKKEAIGQGAIYHASVMDYEWDTLGVETPMYVGYRYPVVSGGQKTVLEARVDGEPFFDPVNVRHEAGKQAICWEEPQRSPYPVEGYLVCEQNGKTDTLPASARSYSPVKNGSTYAVKAMYRRNGELALSAGAQTVKTEHKGPKDCRMLELDSAGLVVPGVFAHALPEATIEFWIRPNSWKSWNQGMGPGWGNWLIHANDDGSIAAGWDGENRMNTRPGVIVPGKWYHLAFVVDGDSLAIYVNGKSEGGMRAKGRKGIGGFGDFPLNGSGEGAWDADLAELRFWKTARSAEEIRGMMYRTYAELGRPKTLLAYYNGGVIAEDKKKYWADRTGQHPALLVREQGVKELPVPRELTDSKPMQEAVRILAECTDTVWRTGQPFRPEAETSPGIERMRWLVVNAKGDTLTKEGAEPVFFLSRKGNYELILEAWDRNGGRHEDRQTIQVKQPEVSADFAAVFPEIKAGERVTFLPEQVVPGAEYHWSLKGAEAGATDLHAVNAVYARAGVYPVKLTVKDPVSGKRDSKKLFWQVKNVKPQPEFDLSRRVVICGQKVELTDRSKYLPNRWDWRVESNKVCYRKQGRHVELVPEEPGVYDVTLTAGNEEGTASLEKKQTLIVCRADSKNGLNFTRPEAGVRTEKSPVDGPLEEMTVEWWMYPAEAEQMAGIGMEGSWSLSAAKNGALTLVMDSLKYQTPAGMVICGQWHHYAVRFRKGTVDFLRDGKMIHTQTHRREAMKAGQALYLGGKEHPMSAVVDEFRFWNRALEDTLLQNVANRPLDETWKEEHGEALKPLVYYDFNQTGGNVTDRSGFGNAGIRSGFGPDGDAWGCSEGVFSLDIDVPMEDCTDKTLPVAKRPFATTGKSVNQADEKRFKEWNSGAWMVENAVSGEKARTGIYVDGNKGDALCVYTGWDGFASQLKNHKLYCTVELEPGRYVLEWIPAQGSSTGTSQMVVASGKGLPDRAQLKEAMAWGNMSDGKLTFEIPEKQTVSMGFLFELSGKQGVAIDQIKLFRKKITE